MADVTSEVGTVGMVDTVLGPVRADELGVVAVHEAVLSVFPGAQFAADVEFDRAEIFDTLAAKLEAFREAGGGTLVDSTGMFHGRDLPLLEALARATGVHLVGSTGMGPESMLGGYFLTPQTNPPTPWPAEKFADLFGQEITEGMVIPRRERRAPAGLITTASMPGGMTGTDESLYRGAARAARATGVPVSIRYGADALADLGVLRDEGLDSSRVLVGGLDRQGAPAAAVAEAGAYVAIDHVGLNDSAEHLTDTERVELVRTLVADGHTGRIILSCNAIGVAKGMDGYELPYETVLTQFVPRLREAGVSGADIDRILVTNPAALLTVAPRA